MDLFETPAMQEVARKDWEEAVSSGMDLGMVEWLGKEEMLQVRVFALLFV